MTSLVISASSPRARRRVEAAWSALCERMPAEMVERVARATLVFAVDADAHGGFSQGYGALDPAIVQDLAAAPRPGAEAPLPLHVVVLVIREYVDVARLLGHELGHVVLGHCITDRAAAASLTEAELDARERAADDFAGTYAPAWR